MGLYRLEDFHAGQKVKWLRPAVVGGWFEGVIAWVADRDPDEMSAFGHAVADAEIQEIVAEMPGKRCYKPAYYKCFFLPRFGVVVRVPRWSRVSGKQLQLHYMAPHPGRAGFQVVR